MACHYFGPVDLQDSDAGEILAKWTASCLAERSSRDRSIWLKS